MKNLIEIITPHYHAYSVLEVKDEIQHVECNAIVSTTPCIFFEISNINFIISRYVL